MKRTKDERRTLALIWGGEGKEHDVSRLSAEYVKRILDGNKYRLLSLYIDREGLWHPSGRKSTVAYPCLTRKGGGILSDGEFQKIDVALPLLHGDMGEDGVIQGALRCAHIPFVGADTVTGAVACDKGYTKAVAERLGIPTAKWIYCTDADAEKWQSLAEKSIGYPMFIKPSRLGSSIGACAVRTKDAFGTAFAEAARIGSGRVLIEELIENKRELEIAYFSAGGQRIISHPAEVLCDGFYSYERKYKSSAKTVTRAELSPEVSALLCHYASILSDGLGLRHLSRIDFFLSGDRVIFNEINTMPGFTEISLYPKILSECGITPTALFDLLIEDALSEGSL